MDAFYLYADAAVKGDWIVDSRDEPARSYEGMAGGAWIGWVGHDTERRPDVAGMEYLGPRTGPQEAEMLATYHGMRSSLRFTERVECAVEDIVVHTDNKWVAGILEGRYEAHSLRELRTMVRHVQGEFECLGVAVHYEWTPRETPLLKIAHCMSQASFKHTLPSPSWRPEDKQAFLARRRPATLPPRPPHLGRGLPPPTPKVLA